MALNFAHHGMLDSLPKPRTIRDPYRDFRYRGPHGESGDWKISPCVVKPDIALYRLMRDGRGTPPGTYTQLTHKTRGVIMSDTDAEIEDLRHYRSRLRGAGRVLIHGLGLGIAVKMALACESVAHVDVVELEPDVIKLTGPALKDKRLTIHRGDCFKRVWPPGTKWDVVWHDIWDAICADNLPSMRELSRKFGRRCKWQACWGRELIHRG